MKKLNRNQVKNASTYILVTAAFLILQVLSTQGKLNSTTKGFLVPACAYIVLAVSLNLLVGICGELSLGHAGFMGIGAFTGIVVTSLLAEAVPNGVLRLVMGMVAGGVLAGVVGFLIGIPVLRLRGDYLAIVTSLNLMGDILIMMRSANRGRGRCAIPSMWRGWSRWCLGGPALETLGTEAQRSTREEKRRTRLPLQL